MIFSKDVRVSSVEDLISETKEVRESPLWVFRGQSNVEWKLIPKAGRTDFFVKNEKEFFGAWKRRAIEYVETRPDSNWDWLAIAQHYGFPIRLLDWSHNLMVAAFFAVNENPEADGSISIFRPKYHVLRENVEPFDYDGLSLFRPTAFTGRVSRQSGSFTIHGPVELEIVHEPASIGELRRLTIPSEQKKSIMRDLDSLGINYSSIYPDLEGLSRHLNWIGTDSPLRDKILEGEHIEPSAV